MLSLETARTIGTYVQCQFKEIVSSEIHSRPYYIWYEPFLAPMLSGVLGKPEPLQETNGESSRFLVAVITPSRKILIWLVSKCTSMLLLVVPQITPTFATDLERICTGKDVKAQSLHLDYVFLDPGLRILPFKNFFRSVFCKGGDDLMLPACYALGVIEMMNGKIPNVHVHGKRATLMYNMMGDVHEELKQVLMESSRTITSLIIIDRDMDIVTPLLPQGSVEGLIDEFLGARFGVVELPKEISLRSLGHNQRIWNLYQKKDTTEGIMADHVYQYIRYKMVDHSAQFLFKVSEQTAPEKGEEMVPVNGMIVEQEQFDALNIAIRDYVTVLDEIMKRAMSIDSYQRVKEAIFGALGGQWTGYEALIRELMYARGHYSFAAQLMLLYCALKDGVPEELLDEFKNEMVLRFGLHTHKYLESLNRAGLLSRTRTPSWSRIKRWFKLEEAPQEGEESFGYDGYIPLTVRMVQADLDEKLSVADYKKVLGQHHVSVRRKSTQKPESVLVYFIGGVTQLELAWLSWLSDCHFGGRVKISVMATEILTAERYVRECFPFLRSEPTLQELAKANSKGSR